MNSPQIFDSQVIGEFAGQPMHSWAELAFDGTIRRFEEYATTVYMPSMGRDMGLTLVREVVAA